MPPTSTRDRYDHLRRYGTPLTECWGVNDPALACFLQRIQDLGIVTLADAAFTPKQARAQPRFGLTVIHPERPPLIYVILQKHSDLPELADTLFHEAIHATAGVMGRHDVLPEDQGGTAYLLEELCAVAGALEIYRRLAMPTMKAKARENRDLGERLKRALRARGCPLADIAGAVADGAAAAAHLLG